MEEKTNNTSAAVDDGHFNNKGAILVDNKLVLYIRPTLIRPGLDGSGLNNSVDGEYGYKTTGENGEVLYFTVSSVFHYSQSESLCDTQNKSYQTSPAARVMVHHMLHMMGLANKNVDLVTSSPIDRFFLNGKPDKAYLQARTKSLSTKVESVSGDSVNITSHIEYPEGWAAFQNHLIELKSSGKDNLSLSLNADLKAQDVLYFDFGGQTLDIASIERGRLIVKKSFSIENAGMLAIHDALKGYLRTYRENISSKELDDVIRTGKFRVAKALNSESINVEQEVNQSISYVLSMAVDKINARFKTSDYDQSIAVGGSALTLDKHISMSFAHVMVSKDALEANVFGLFKRALLERNA